VTNPSSFSHILWVFLFVGGIPEITAMLKVTIGSEVEALSKKSVDVGAWVCAKVTKISSYTFTVNYGSRDGKIIEETVPRRAVRPVPPPLEGVANFTPGDIVECCHDFFWKTAKIFKASGNNFFLVILLGDNVEFIVHRSFLRVRQRWTGCGWCVVGKKSPSQYIENRMHALAKRKPCEDDSPIKKGIAGGCRKRRRLDEEEEDRESVGSNSVGDESKRDDEAESVSTKRRNITLDRDHIAYRLRIR
jgi:hypothetical protein